MTHSRLRTWGIVHKWTSLICTVFLLLICVTGLPLIFHHEIEEAFDPAPPPALTGAPAAVDPMVAAAKRAVPGWIIGGVYLDPEAPVTTVYFHPSHDAIANEPYKVKDVAFAQATGERRGAGTANPAEGFILFMYRLHVDLFVLLPGMLFMGAMGLLFLVAIVSGVVLYGPFTRKLEFGAVRKQRATRVKWLDFHNLLGIITLAWAVVVGFTGALNEISGPLYNRYIATDVAAAIAPWKGETPPARDAKLASVDGVIATVTKAFPDRKITFVSFPGNPFGSPHHYFVWTQGSSALNARLQTPVLVDATTGKLSAAVPMPWYIRAIEVSRPLHFGDYGGLPLKIIWALFDIATIVVLGSGLYLWIARGRSVRRTDRYAPQLQPAE